MYVAPPVSKPRRISDVRTWPAPVSGWIANANLAAPPAGGACVMDNFFPTATGARLRYGSEKYATLEQLAADQVVNGTFAVDANWTKNAGVTISGGLAHFTATPSGNRLAQGQALTAGTTYKSVYTVSGFSAGGVKATFTGGVQVNGTTRTANGTYTDYLIAVTGNASLTFEAVGATTLDIDNVTMQEVTDAAPPVRSLMVYKSGTVEEFFAATDTDIFEITSPSDPNTPPAADVTGLTSGGWSHAQFTNAAGTFLTLANGADPVQQYNGTIWSEPVITGVTSSDLSFVWQSHSRLFFVEQGTMSAWYLGINSISGAATELSLGGIFTKGGSLLFGATWSITAQDANAYTVFVSTEGEVAVYQGTDPSSIATWGLVGIYFVGKPKGPKAFVQAGGELLIATNIGEVPLSQALRKDQVALSAVAASWNIEDEWLKAVDERAQLDWHMTVWTEGQMIFVGIPAQAAQQRYSFVQNARTGAWGRYTVWDVRCLGVFNGNLYFGTGTGTIVQAEVTGADQGQVYSGACVALFDMLDAGAAMKLARNVRTTVLSSAPLSVKSTVLADFDKSLPLAPDVTPFDPGGALWGSGIWGQSVWGGGAAPLKRRGGWQSSGTQGQALAPCVQVSSGQVTRIECQLVSQDVTWETTDVLG